MRSTALEIVERTQAGSRCWVVRQWQEEGVVHGFLGADFDLRKHSWAELPTQRSTELLCLLQQHGTSAVEILTNDDAKRCGRLASGDDHAPPADAWLFDGKLPFTSRYAFAVKTADCVPVLLVDAERRYRAVLHCGWRGIAARLLPLTIDRFNQLGAPPSRIEIALGPAAGSCCYEVDAPVADALRLSIRGGLSLTLQDVAVLRGDRIFANLTRVLRLQALQSGVSEGAVGCCEQCTICSPEFFSFRRQKELAGRQLSYLAGAVC